MIIVAFEDCVARIVITATVTLEVARLGQTVSKFSDSFSLAMR